MTQVIDPYSYALGVDHAKEVARPYAVALAHDLALIEDLFRQVENGKEPMTAIYYRLRGVFDVQSS